MPQYTATKTVRTKNSIFVANAAASTGTLSVLIGELQTNAGNIPAGENRIVEINGSTADLVNVTFSVTGSVTYEISQVAN